MFRFTIPIAPKTKKNSQQIRYKWNAKKNKSVPYITQGEAYKQYEFDCLRIITGQYKKCVDVPVNVKAIYYMPSDNKVDITNLHSALHDILVVSGVLKDDNSKIVKSTDGSRVYVDRNNPRTEIEITKFVEAAK